jgi:magnesium-transporting ATPase (P-type)
MVYFGTALNSGTGVAVVVATGSRTELGKIANFAA